MLKKQKKRHQWAIRHDLIFVIVFVILCTVWYKTVIEGAYWGIALHAVGEPNNESYTYHSDEDEWDKPEESVTSSSLGFNAKEDNSIINKDLTHISRN